MRFQVLFALGSLSFLRTSDSVTLEMEKRSSSSFIERRRQLLQMSNRENGLEAEEREGGSCSSPLTSTVPKGWGSKKRKKYELTCCPVHGGRDKWQKVKKGHACGDDYEEKTCSAYCSAPPSWNKNTKKRFDLDCCPVEGGSGKACKKVHTGDGCNPDDEGDSCTAYCKVPGKWDQATKDWHDLKCCEVFTGTGTETTKQCKKVDKGDGCDIEDSPCSLYCKTPENAWGDWKKDRWTLKCCNKKCTKVKKEGGTCDKPS
uniref:Uncharacterized protein n=1 Tax=Chromera velia CCMP2878 TaxID=1169474 RepID=A0A0G4IBW6_9ALVE|eukprot:Cvel_12965.t1-p1 / transcript=Cvel_12965.t1 / gene=Cvel_12965 / organism=Chromera_velia_CCMP2878 / gene_product=hypothetical protein / transcript_product=hypothetical protein / location=Cvel_scaffold868:14904-15677(+) / protein_length=258 / sequence_SO=supercontig / SO=protein_coding / is_pseudo=false